MLRALARVPTFRSLQHRDWAALWLAGHLWHLCFWMDLIVLGWLVLEWTGSPFLVALVGASRLAPMGLLGAVAGAFGDRLSRKRMLVAAQVINLSATLAFCAVLAAGREEVWLAFAAALCTGAAWAIDFPVRRAYLRDLLPEDAVVNAMALDAASLTGMQMLGRWTAGVLLAFANPPAAYAFMAGCYALGMAVLLRMPDTSRERGAADAAGSAFAAVRADLGAGLAYVWRNPVLRGILLVTLAINLFVAPYLQMTPVFAREVYGVGPGLLGLISGMDGLGALTGAIILASATGLRRLGLVFVGGALALAAFVTLFSQIPAYWLALPVMVAIGLGVSGFATMQTTLSVVYASPEMRGRAMGAVALGIGAMPIGMALVGALAEALGAPTALGMTASLALLLIVVIGVLQPALRRA